MTVIFVHVEQLASVSGTRQMLPRLFAIPAATPLSLRCCTCVSVCAFHVRGYLECTLCSEALRIDVCRDIFVYVLGSWTILSCVMLFEVLAFLNSLFCDILFLTAKFSIKYRILNSTNSL